MLAYASQTADRHKSYKVQIGIRSDHQLAMSPHYSQVAFGPSRFPSSRRLVWRSSRMCDGPVCPYESQDSCIHSGRRRSLLPLPRTLRELSVPNPISGTSVWPPPLGLRPYTDDHRLPTAGLLMAEDPARPLSAQRFGICPGLRVGDDAAKRSDRRGKRRAANGG